LKPDYDRRLTPARGDIAAEGLRGHIDAERYVRGEAVQVCAGAAAIRKAPSLDAALETQALFGDNFTLYERNGDWGWGQALSDGYVGYVALADLAAPPIAPTHRISALRTFVFADADLKSTPVLALSMNCKITAEEESGRFLFASRAGWIFKGHLSGLEDFAPDWVGEAERFVGAPYLWGGKVSLGTDCSGLIQTALNAAGVECLRDADMQEAALGEQIIPARDLSNLRRGDIVFWKGHVGVMLDGERLLHANAFHMATAIEPLREAVERIMPAAGPITSVKRLKPSAA
jgi:cell wall-associated NlpC family hydrolase